MLVLGSLCSFEEKKHDILCFGTASGRFSVCRFFFCCCCCCCQDFLLIFRVDLFPFLSLALHLSPIFVSKNEWCNVTFRCISVHFIVWKKNSTFLVLRYVSISFDWPFRFDFFFGRIFKANKENVQIILKQFHSESNHFSVQLRFLLISNLLMIFHQLFNVFLNTRGKEKEPFRKRKRRRK